MNNKDNFKWLVDDLYDALILKVSHINKDKKVEYLSYDVLDILDTTGRELDIEFANINDISNLITMGIVRFKPLTEMNGLIDIPFRKMHKLLENAHFLTDDDSFGQEIKLEDVDGFSPFEIVGIEAYANGYLSDDLVKLIDIAKVYGSLNMQDKFDALSEANDINYNRIKNNKLNSRV